jgi:hypothetical protein
VAFETTEHRWLLDHALPLVIILVSSIGRAFVLFQVSGQSPSPS